MMRVVALLLPLALFLQDTAVQDLIKQLGSDSIEVREEATQKLKSLGEAAKPALEVAAKGGHAETATRARHLLRILEVRPLVTPGLLKAIPDAVERLAGAENNWTAVLLEATVFMPRSTGLRYPFLVRKDLEFLALPALKSAVDSKQREEVVHRINQWGFKVDVSAIAKLLQDADVSLLRSVMNYLRRTGPETTPLLIDALKHQDAQVRQSAVALLGERRESVVVPHLREMLDKGPVESRFYALITLINLEGTAAAKKDVLKHLDEFEPESVAKLLGALRDPDQAPRLYGMIRHRDQYVRGAAMEALRRLQPLQYFDEFVRMLDDPKEDEDFRYLAAAAVATMGTADHGEKFLFMLKDPDKQKRLTGVVRLTELDVPGHAKHLLPMLLDPHPSVRIFAAGGLYSLGSNDVDSVLPLLDPKDPSYCPDPAGPAMVVANMAMRSDKEVRDRMATYFKKLEENPATELSMIASVALVRMGLKDRAAQRALVERVESSPMYRQYANFLCDSLALAHEPKLRERIEVKRPIENGDDLNAALKSAGLRVEAPWPMKERIRAGRTLSVFEILRRSSILSFNVEQGVIRFSLPGTYWAALDRWNELLKP